MNVRGKLSIIGVGVSLAARAMTPIADGKDVAFQHPSICDGGQVVTLDRVHYVDAGACSDIGTTDVYLYRYEAGCGRTVLTPFTTDHVSRDACPSADGSRIAWRTFDAGTGQNEVKIADVDGTGVQTLFTCAGTMSDLELSPNAEFVVVKVVGRSMAGQAEIIRFAVASPLPDVVDVGPSADSLELNSHRCIDENGVVLYSKSVGGPHDLFKDAPGASPPEWALPPSPEDERNLSIAASGGHECVFLRHGLDAIDNLFWISPAGGVYPVTNNANPGWFIRQPTISATGLLVAFASTGDFAAMNPDGSMEAFSISRYGGSTYQWSNYEPNPPLPGEDPDVAGIDLKDDSVSWTSEHAVVFGVRTGPVSPVCCPGCWVSTDSLNGTNAWTASHPPVSPTVTDLERPETLPPYEAEIVTCTGSPLPTDPDLIACTIAIHNSGEGARRFLIYSVTDFGSSGCTDDPPQRHSPAEFSLLAAKTGRVTLGYSVSCNQPPRRVVFDIVSPDSGQPDVVRLAHEF